MFNSVTHKLAYGSISPSISLIRPMLNSKQQELLELQAFLQLAALTSISGSVWNVTLLPSCWIHQSPALCNIQYYERERGRGEGGREEATIPYISLMESLPQFSCPELFLLWIDRMSAQSFGNCAPVGPGAEWGSPFSVHRVHAGWQSCLAQYLWSIHTIIIEQAARG